MSPLTIAGDDSGHSPNANNNGVLIWRFVGGDTPRRVSCPTAARWRKHRGAYQSSPPPSTRHALTNHH